GRNARENSFFLCQPTSHGKSILVRDLNALGDLGFTLFVFEVQVSWDESRPCSLNFVLARLQGLPGQTLRNDGRILRLDSNRLERWFAGLDNLVTASDGSTRTDCGNQDVHLAIGVSPDFFGRRFPMNFRIGRILELLGNP